MSWKAWLLGLVIACLVPAAPATAQPPQRVGSARPEVQVRASVDRSAMWVGDRVRYEVAVLCPRGVDILDDDLAREKLKLDGLEAVGSDSARETGADETTTHRFTYLLTTYRVDAPMLRVNPISLRYYVKRPGQRLEDVAPAGEVQVPGAQIALRSVLPDQQETAELRDGRRPVPRRAAYALAQPVGLAVIVLSLVPSVLWTISLVRERGRRVVRRSARQVREAERASLESVKELDVSMSESRRQAYSGIDAIVREHLRDVFGVPGPSLTPTEVGPAMEQRHARAPSAAVAALLAECERARYASPESLPSADDCREAIDRAEQVLTVR